MTRQQRIRAIAAWLNDLATISCGSQPVPNLKTKIAAMAPMLADEFEPSAFTQASMRAVAGAQARSFFPGYGEICAGLSEWRAANPPPTPAIAGPKHDPNAALRAQRAAEREEVAASWRDLTPEQLRAKLRALEGHPMRPALGRLLRTILERHCSHLLPMLPPDLLNDTSPAAQQPAPDWPEPAAERPRPYHLPPDVLDRINPLPNGRKRANA